MIEQRTLGQTDVRVGAIALGAMAFAGFYGGGEDAAGVSAIRRALDAGITLIDTAEAYGQGRSEGLVGRAIAGRRDEAVVATMVTFGVMLALYMTGVIKVTKKFQSIMLVALVSYLVLGLGNLIWAMFGGGDGMGIYGTGFGPIVAVLGVLIAAFFLLLDFEAISQGIKLGAPERESWRMAFGLLVTLIWLYLEFLRLLAIFSRN